MTFCSLEKERASGGTTQKPANDPSDLPEAMDKLANTPGSRDWQYASAGIQMTYLNGHIGDAQEGVKYVGEESVGGYDTKCGVALAAG